MSESELLVRVGRAMGLDDMRIMSMTEEELISRVAARESDLQALVTWRDQVGRELPQMVEQISDIRLDAVKIGRGVRAEAEIIERLVEVRAGEEGMDTLADVAVRLRELADGTASEATILLLGLHK